MKKIFLSTTTFFLSLYLSCSVYAQEELQVVTSIPPINALAAGVLSGVTQPTMLVPQEASHHYYVLKPSNMQALAQADVVIWIGNSLETFLQKPLNSLPATTQIITVQTLPTLTIYPVRTSKNWQQEDEHHHGHVHAGMDPHLWLDPDNAIIIIRELSSVFSQQDPQHAVLYQKNAVNMIEAIKQKDDQIKQELLPVKDKKFLVFHDGYQYFEKHYGLHAAGAVTINAELSPSAQRLHQLHQQIQSENIACIFAEQDTSSALINTLQRDSDIHLGKLDTLGKGQRFEDYLELLKYDANAFKTCLS